MEKDVLVSVSTYLSTDLGCWSLITAMLTVVGKMVLKWGYDVAL